MTRLHAVLLAALGIQAALTAATWWPSESTQVEARPMVELNPDNIDSIVIERSGEGAETLKILREGDGWMLANSAGYPALNDKVQELLDTVLDIRVRRPVATRAVNHDALHVGSNDWGKKVSIGAGGIGLELVLGAASGRATHVRRQGTDEVYAVRGLSEWSIKDRPSSYWEPAVVDIDVGSATAVTVETRAGASIQLLRGDGGWTFEGEVPEGELIDPDKLDRLADAACSLRLRAPVGQQALPEHGFEAPSARVTISHDEDESSAVYSYALGNTVDGETFLQRPDSPWIVTVSEHSTEELSGASVEGLLLSLDEGPPAGGMGGMPQGLPPGLDPGSLGL